MKKRMVALNRLGLFILILLAATLPFELEAPWLSLGPIVLTNVEVILGIALLLTLLGWLQGRARFSVPKVWLFLGVLFIIGLLLSSLMAPELRANALKASMRTISGILLALAVPHFVKSQRDFLWVVVALVGGGFLAAFIGMIEFASGAPIAWLRLFRIFPTMAGPYLRLTGPFDYANQTAMFIEATMPLLLALTWSAYQAGRKLLAIVLGSILLLYVEASFLTFSRSSFATILLVSLLMGLFFWFGASPQQRRQSYLWLGTAVVIFLFIPANLLLSPVFQLRLSSEGDNEWYKASIQVPTVLSMTADGTLSIPVTVVNEGALTWNEVGANPITLKARWVQAATDLEWSHHSQWPLEQQVQPGESVALEVSVRAPKKSGAYRLMWDLVQEDVVWFTAKNGIVTSSEVTVMENSNLTEDPDDEMTMVQTTAFTPPIPGRLALWQAAWQQFLSHPLLGIGLDNFRLTYGRQLGYSDWNRSVHTNSWYWETVVSLGLIGSIPFFTWLAVLVIDIISSLRKQAAKHWETALAAGLLAYLIHGLLDYFLLFNATALLFWLLVGLWMSRKSFTGNYDSYASRI